MGRFAQENINGLTAANIEVLQALGEYRYLTPSQIIELGIIGNSDSFYRLMKRFEVFTQTIVGKAAFLKSIAMEDLDAKSLRMCIT